MGDISQNAKETIGKYLVLLGALSDLRQRRSTLSYLISAITGAMESLGTLEKESGFKIKGKKATYAEVLSLLGTQLDQATNYMCAENCMAEAQALKIMSRIERTIHQIVWKEKLMIIKQEFIPLTQQFNPIIDENNMGFGDPDAPEGR